ncbi:MAG: protein kinase [Bryobacteraceae bacterium]
MTVQQRSRIREIFADALDLPPQDRAAFVATQAADDDAIRDETLRLLAHHDDAPAGFLAPLVPGPSAAAAFAPGQRVAARYRIEQRIGYGGMGEVYSAWDETLDQRIALKTIRPGLAATPAMLDRLRREVSLARNVTHPNVCRVFDFGEHTGPEGPIAFLTMECLEGETLAARLARDGPMKPVEALAIIRQVAAALDAAHEAGVVHRDFKPSNVMLVPAEAGDRAIVMDFGLARSVRRDGAPLTISVAAGTPDYMAPEQWKGGEVGPPADIFALGVVVREMLTGNEPSVAQPAIPEPWARAIDQCLSPQPDARPRPAAEVVAAIERPNRWSGRTISLARWLLPATAVAVALFFGALRIANQEGKGIKPGASAARDVAVLPFRASEADIQPFADGLMVAITQRLSQYEGVNQTFSVAPASETRRANVTSPGTAKSLLGANFAVEGTLQSQDGRLRLMMTVIDTATLRQVETVMVEGTRTKAFSLQDQAVQKLVTALDLRALPTVAADLNRLSPVEPGAYEFYLQAKGYLQRSDRINDVNSAIELLERSIALGGDPAPAQAALGEAYWYKFERTADPQWVPKARAACARALELEPHLSTARITLGRILSGTGHHLDAIREFQLALERDPRSADAYLGLGRAYTLSRDYSSAEATYRKAIELRPREWRGYREFGMFYYHRSDYRSAIEQFEKVVQLTPDSASAFNNLGGFYGLLGDKKKAREMLVRAADIEPGRISTLTNLTKLLFDEGRVDEALARWKKAIDIEPESHNLWGNLAASQDKAGRRADAQESYRTAVSLVSKAIGVNPGNGELFSFRAHYLASLGRTREALADLAKTGSLQSGELEMLVRDAVTHVVCRRPASALPYLRRAFEKGLPARAGSSQRVSTGPRNPHSIKNRQPGRNRCAMHEWTISVKWTDPNDHSQGKCIVTSHLEIDKSLGRDVTVSVVDETGTDTVVALSHAHGQPGNYFSEYETYPIRNRPWQARRTPVESNARADVQKDGLKFDDERSPMPR